MTKVGSPATHIKHIGTEEFEQLLETSLQKQFAILAERLESKILTLAEQLQTCATTPSPFCLTGALREPSGRTPTGAPYAKNRASSNEYEALNHNTALFAEQTRSSSRDVKIANRQASFRSTPCAEGLYGFVKSKRFNEMVAVAIFINALTLGVEADYMARHWEADGMPAFFEYINSFLCLLFMAEMILRVLVFGRKVCARRNLSWTLASFLVTGVQCAEEVLKLSVYFRLSVDSKWRSTLRLLRTLRVVMIFPVLDHLHAIDELNLLVVSVLGSLKSLSSTLFVLVLITFVFGVPLTHIVTNFKVTHPHDHEAIAELSEFYSSLDQTMVSLFQAISEGIHWRELLMPLTAHCSPWLTIAFIVYMLITVFAMTNVVTGIFVDSAVKTSETDKRGRISRGMLHLFAEADIDGSGTISREEFEEHLKDNKEMKTYLRALQIEDELATEMFNLLDKDGSGTIDRDEFVYGCLRLQGAAKAIDFASFVCEQREVTAMLSNKVMTIQEQLRKMEGSAKSS